MSGVTAVAECTCRRAVVLIGISLLGANALAQDSEDRGSAGQQIKDGVAGAVIRGVDSGAQIIGNTIACVIARIIDPNTAECQERRSSGGPNRNSDDEDDAPSTAGRLPNRPLPQSQGQVPRIEQRPREPAQPFSQVPRSQPGADRVSAEFLSGYWCVRGGIGHFQFRPAGGDAVVVDSLRGNAVPIVQRISQVADRVFKLQAAEGGSIVFEQINANTLRRIVPINPEVLFVRCDVKGRVYQ